MRSRLSLLAGLLMMMAFMVASARDGQAAEPAADQPIATVLEKPIYLKDLDIDENDTSELREYFAIAGRIMPPLVAKYVKDHKLAATPQEIKEYRDWFSARRRATPADKNLPPEVRKKFEDVRTKSATPGTPEYLGLDEIARSFVERWKFNKDLHAKYGGRVIAQQLGPEPLDAYEAWLRDEEKAGSFEIYDAKWKDAIWEYYQPKHHVFLDQPDPFKAPLWKMVKDAKDDPARRNED